MDRDMAMRGDRSQQRGPMALRTGHPSRRAALTNIDYEIPMTTIKKWLSDTAGVETQFAFIFNGQNGPKGKGFADFKTQADRDTAIEKCHREKLNEREVYVRTIDPEYYSMYGLAPGGGMPPKGMPGMMSPIRPPMSRPPGPGGFMSGAAFGPSGIGLAHPQARAPRPTGYTGPTGPVEYGNTYGLNSNFLQSLGIHSKLISRVFVTNLNTSNEPVTEKLMRDVFRLAGKVVHVELHNDPEGALRSIAHIDFQHPVEAVQAISMFHGQELNGRPMSVRMDAKSAEFDGYKLPPGLKGIGLGLGSNGKPLQEVAASLSSEASASGGSGDRAKPAEFSNGSGSEYPAKQETQEKKLSDTIIVSNLPSYMDETTLKASFSLHGQILFCEIRGQGCGIIRYSTDTEANRCIMMMDKQRLGNNILEVNHFTIGGY